MLKTRYPTCPRAAGIVATVGLLMLAVACSDDPVSPGSDTTTLSVYLTDAPGEVADVWVEIADVRLVGEGEPVSLLDERTELINLLELEDQSMLLIDDFELEEGTYAQLRFVIDAAVLETVDGAVYTLGGAEHPLGMESTGILHCPSCGQSGLKVNFAGGLEIAEGDNAVLVDFDVSQSFGRQAGQSGRWVMHPVIQGTAVDPDDPDAEVGTISGEVVLTTDVSIPACADEDRGLQDFVPVAVSATLEDSEGDPLTFQGSADTDGEFEIQVLESDNYVLGYRDAIVLDGWELRFTADVDPASVDAEVGDTAGDVMFTITEASCVASD